MGEQETIALNIQLPTASLDGFARLVEQLRYLAAELKSSGAASAPVSSVHTVESGENPLFDPQRYQVFLRPAEAAPAGQGGTDIVPAAHTGAAGGPSGRDGPVGEPDGLTASEARAEDVLSALSDPGVAEAGAVEGPAGTERTAVPLSAAADLTDTAASGQDRRISTVGASTDGGKSGERSAPEVRTAVADPPPVSGDVLSPIQPPPAADYAISPVREVPGRRRGGPEEVPAQAEDRSLTAREISQAFRRDGRRYDNGFQLY